MLKRIGITIIGMLGNVFSKLAKECDVVLNVSVKEEACPHDLAPTASTTASLAAPVSGSPSTSGGRPPTIRPWL